mgnify:CR=1 FL=1
MNLKNQWNKDIRLNSLKISKKKFLKSFLFLMVLFLIIGGCSFSKHLNKERLDPYQKNLNVVYKIIHPSFESSQLLLQTQASTYRLVLKAYSDASRKEIIYDETIAINEGNNLLKSFELKIKRTTYVLELILTNLGTNEVFRDIQYLDKTSDNSQTILPYFENENPLVQNYISKGTSLKFIHTDPKISTFYVRHYKDSFKPAHAPHIRSSRAFLPMQGNSTIKKINKNELYKLSEAGLYFIQVDTLSKLGRFINCFDDDYPQLTDINELIESTRYITKNVEYETLNKSNEKKIALEDKTWKDVREDVKRNQNSTLFGRLKYQLGIHNGIPKKYTSKSTEIVDNEMKKFQNLKIVDFIMFEDYDSVGFLELENGNIITETLTAPHGTGMAGLNIFENLKDFEESCGTEYKRLKNSC